MPPCTTDRRCSELVAAALLASALAGAAAAHAGDQSWTSERLIGGTVSALAVDPRPLGPIYAGTPDAGLWKSDDGGRTWRSPSLGVDRWGVSDLDLDPLTTDHLVAATSDGVRHSVDGGNTWSSPGPPLALLARAGGGTLYGSDHGSILRSDDGGDTWLATTALASGFYVHDLAGDPTSGAIAYAATNGGVLATRDGGVHWRRMNRGLSTNPRAVFTVAIAVDPLTPSTVYVANLDGSSPNGSTVFRSIDRGAHWQPLLTNLGPEGEVDVTAIVPLGQVLVVADNRARPHPHGELWRSGDGGASWHRVKLAAEIQTVAAAPDGAQLYAGLFAAGALVSTDSGLTWRPSRAGLEALGASAIGVDPTAAHGPLVATVASHQFGSGGAGLVRPGPRRQTWLPAAVGLAIRGAGPLLTSVVFDPDHPPVVYAAGSDGLYLSRDGGSVWSHTTAGGSLNEVIVTAAGDVWAVGHEDLACGIPFCGLLPVPVAWHSGDGGDTWQRAVDGIDPGGTVPARKGALSAVAGDPANGWVYAGGRVGNAVLFARPTVAGPWLALPAAGLPGTVSALLTLPFAAPPPGEPTPLLAAVDGTGPCLWRSLDAGATFQPSADGLPANLQIHRLLASGDGRSLFAASDAGVYRSTDDGATWQPLGSELQGFDVLGLGWAPATRGGTLYAASPRPPGLFAYTP